MSFHHPSPYRHPPSLSPPPSSVRIIHRSVSPIPSQSHPSSSSIFLPPPPSSIPPSSHHSPSFHPSSSSSLPHSFPPPTVFHHPSTILPPATLPPAGPPPREGRWQREDNDLAKENAMLKKKMELLEEIIRNSGLEEIETKIEKLMKENRKLTSLIQKHGKEGFCKK